MGEYNSVILDQDRAFSINDLDELLEGGKDILNRAIDISRRIEDSILIVSDVYSGVKSEYRETNLGTDIAKMSHALSNDIYQDTINRMEATINKIINDVPSYDSSLARSMDDIQEALYSVKGRINELKELLNAGDVGVDYTEFSEKLRDLRSGWNATAGNLATVLAEIEKDILGVSAAAAQYSEDPVNLSTGNFVYDHEDMKVGGEILLTFHRYYNSKDRSKRSLGRCFLHNYDSYLEENEEKGKVIISMGDGQKKMFRKMEDGTYVSLYSATETLTRETERNWVLTNLSGERLFYNTSGRMVRQENRYGRGITFSYDESGRLEKAEADNHMYLAYSYDVDGLLACVTDHIGRKVELSYAKGKLIRVKVPSGSIYTYCYAKNGRMEEAVNSRGNIAVRNTYDEKRRVIRQEFPDGGRMEFAYDDKKRQVILTERNGSRITYRHDGKYRNTDILYEDGTKEHFAYNGKNQRVLYVDRNGNAIRIAYDDKGNVTQVVNALGEKANLTYNAQNLLLTLKVNGKEKIHNGYDKNGNLVSVIGADGNGKHIAYDEQGRPSSVKNADGSIVRVSYDDRGNIREIMNALGGIITYGYDELNRVTEVIDAKGNQRKYEYDDAGNLTKYMNADGKVRTYSYNESGKVTEIADFDGSRVIRKYNALNKLEALIDQEGRAVRFEYDKMWNLAMITEPNGAITRFSYDQNNRLESIKDALGNKTYFTYDGNGNRLSREDAAGAKTTFSYDAAGRLIRIIDPEGAETCYEYDDEGRLVKTTDALGNETVYIYDATGRLKERRKSVGESRIYEYTVLGNIKSITTEAGLRICYSYLPGETKISGIEYPDGTIEAYTYDANGNLESKTDRGGYIWHYQYDCLDRLTEARGAEGEHISFTYDAVGNVTSKTDALGNVTRYEYSLTGRLVRVIDALGNEAEYTYDENDLLIGILQRGSLEEEMPRKTEYKRNLVGRIEQVTDALGEEEHYKYNQRGELIEKLDRDGYLTRYGYTGCGDLKFVQYADGREVKFYYNPLRQLEEVKDWFGITNIISDAAGRAAEVLYPDGKKIFYVYGDAGKRSSLIYPDGKTVYYEYDKLSRLAEMREGDAVIRYRYDNLGRLTEKNFSNGMTTGYEYDARGLLTSLIHKDNEGILDTFRYQYDLMKNKIGIIRERRGLSEESGHYSYEYDALGRLESVAKDGEFLRKYEYDVFGNRTGLIEGTTEKRYGYNALNQLISEVDCMNEGESEKQFRYDRRGNLIEIFLNGELKNQYDYGALNRLEYAKNAAGEEAEYFYNGIGYRIGRREKTGRKEEYILDLTKPYRNLLQKEEAGNRQTFLWDHGVAGLIEEDSIHKFYFQDELGSPSRLAGADGRLLENYGYDEFGRDLYPDRTQIQPFGYTGYQVDQLAGTYFAQAREYMPSAGRFVSRDKDKFISIKNMKSINLYSYCMSNPVRYTDPSGNDLEDQYPLTANKNDAVQINVSGNDIMIDVYVDFTGDVDLITENGTSCRDMAVAGIENWSGNYLDVFGEDVMVSVNVHEGNAFFWNSQKYVTVDLAVEDGIPRTSHRGEWSNNSDRTIHMHRVDSRVDYMFPDEEYVRTISHEMGHVFGIGDGYRDKRPLSDEEKKQGVIRRPDASELGLIDDDDVMVSQFSRRNISNTDIGMMILAYWEDAHQSFSDYTGHKQSQYFKQEGKQ